MTIIWIIVFIVSLAALVKGADWLLASAEKVGYAGGLSPFVVGVVITGIGTSLPEIASSFFSLRDAPQIVGANAIGSNVANILLVIGFSAVLGKVLTIKKDLLNLEIPLLAASTALFYALVSDRMITTPEAVILTLAAGLYLLYTFMSGADEESPTPKAKRPKVNTKDIVMLVVGMAGLVFGAQFMIKSVVTLSQIFDVATGIIAITAIAIGTSLPELLVSTKAALRGKAEVALGNVFGSNAFNLLLVVGLPGLFKNLPIDEPTFATGLPFLLLATFLFMISCMSRKVHKWEGGFFLLIYVAFCAQLFGLF